MRILLTAALASLLAALIPNSGFAADDADLRPYLRVDLEKVTIRRAPKGRYAMYGGLTLLPEGEIFCVYKVGSRDPETGSPWTVRDETIVWTVSSDRGRAWPGTENLIYRNPQTRQENCCGTGYLAEDGTIRHPFYILNPDYEERAQPQNYSHVHLAETPDRGKSWSIRKIDVPLALAASFGGIRQLDDNTLLWCVYGAAEPNTFRHQSAVLRSTDDGRSWSDYTIIGDSADPDGGPARLNETGLAQLPSGTLVSVSRTQYGGFPLYQGVSRDRGHTWTVRRNGLTGLCPALCATRSGPPEGTLVLVYHDRWGAHESKGGVYIACSTDEGRTWGEPMWISAGAYPCAIEVEPGRMFASYYRGCAELQGALFHVPFPSGLRAVARSEPSGVELRWDSYAGKKAGAYLYRIYRSAEPDFSPAPATQIAEVRGENTFVDRRADADRVWYYRVVVYEGDRPVGRSWAASSLAVSAE